MADARAPGAPRPADPRASTYGAGVRLALPFAVAVAGFGLTFGAHRIGRTLCA